MNKYLLIGIRDEIKTILNVKAKSFNEAYYKMSWVTKHFKKVIVIDTETNGYEVYEKVKI